MDVLPDPVWDGLARFRREAEWPEGCKVQIVGGLVVVEPPPDSAHNDTVDELQRLLYTVIPRDWGAYQALELTVPGGQGLFVPDLAVAPKARQAKDALGSSSRSPRGAVRVTTASTSCAATPPSASPSTSSWTLALRQADRDPVRRAGRRLVPGAGDGEVRRRAAPARAVRRHRRHLTVPRRMTKGPPPRTGGEVGL